MMETAVESGSVGTRASKQAKEGSKNRSRRRWRKGKVKGEPVAARKKVLRGTGGGDWVDGPTSTTRGGGQPVD